MHVFEYGFSFFIEALNEHQIISTVKQKELAFAVRIATKADEKQWRKFMKRK